MSISYFCLIDIIKFVTTFNDLWQKYEIDIKNFQSF